ncbi:MAG: hypothetical protein QM817_36455 [Archangium sp.]
MRFLIAGLVCLAIGLSITEYTRRNPPKKDGETSETTPETKDDGPKKPKWPAPIASLLELDAAGTDTSGPAADFATLLTVPTDAAVAGFAPVVGGTYVAHHLVGAFGASVFVIDAAGRSGIVRAEQGSPAKLLFVKETPFTALDVDGSTLFFASNGVVGETLARGGEPITVRARFKNATVTSIAASGDVLVLTVMPKSADPMSTDAVGAVVALSNTGELSLIAGEVVRPRGAQTDGKDAWWISGETGGLWRGALDGAFTSQLVDKADEPLLLDGDVLYFRAPLGSGTELKRVGRAGGNLASLITADVGYLAATSGLIRFTTTGAGAGLLEMTSGAEATKLLALPGAGRGLAVGGTTLFLLTQGDDGRSVLWAK